MKINKIKLHFIVVFFCIIVCMLVCCQNKQDATKRIDKAIVAKNNSVQWKVTLPDSLEIYKPFNSYLLDSNAIANSNLKIYTSVNVSCATCIEDIEKWNILIAKLAKYKVPVILMCQSKDNFELIKYLCEQGKVKHFPFPFFLDRKEQYFIKNPFLNHSVQDNAVLTDKENKVLLLGNPNHSEDIKAQYISKIEEFIKN